MNSPKTVRRTLIYSTKNKIKSLPSSSRFIGTKVTQGDSTYTGPTPKKQKDIILN